MRCKATVFWCVQIVVPFEQGSDIPKCVVDMLENVDIIPAQGVDSRKVKTTGDSTRGSVGDSVFQGSPLHGNTLETFGVLKISREQSHVSSTLTRPISNKKIEFWGQNLHSPSWKPARVQVSLLSPTVDFGLPRAEE